MSISRTKKAIGPGPAAPGQAAAEQAPPQAAHVLVRVRSEGGHTIAAHRQLIAEHGRVMFAKIGKEISNKFSIELKAQTEKRIPTFLFLAINEGWNLPFSVYQCELLMVHSCLGGELLKLVPDYLKSSAAGVRTWFEISSISRVADGEISRIHILTSGRGVTGAIRGAASLFRVGLSGMAALREVPDPQPIKKSKALSGRFDDEFGEELDTDIVEQYAGTHARR